MKKIFFFFLISTLLTGCEVDSPYPDVAAIQVISNEPFSKACATSFVINDTAFVLFGRNPSTSKAVYYFTPDHTNLVFRTNFPGKQRINGISQVIQGQAYIGLGWDPTKRWDFSAYLTDFWRFNPSKNQWDSLAAFPGKATNNCVSFVYEDELYVMHGFESHLNPSTGFSNACWKYSPTNNSWTQLNDFPGYKRASAVAVTDGKRVFAGTGYATWNEMDWWEYFPDSDTWKRRKSMPDKGRCNATAFCIDGRFFVSGGRYFAGNYTGGHVKDDLMEYDAEKDVWYNRGTIPGPRENAISFVLGNKAYIGFGENMSGTIYTDLQSIEP